jgi:hypothetical protein
MEENNEELHSLYFTHNIVRKDASHIACIEEINNFYIIVVVKRKRQETTL